MFDDGFVGVVLSYLLAHRMFVTEFKICTIYFYLSSSLGPFLPLGVRLRGEIVSNQPLCRGFFAATGRGEIRVQSVVDGRWCCYDVCVSEAGTVDYSTHGADLFSEWTCLCLC